MPEGPSKVLYKTLSICPQCALVNRKGLSWQTASVVKYLVTKQVWLVVHCYEHGDQESHYCSNARFFKDAMSYAPPKDGLRDIEDFQDLINIEPTIENFPLVLELALFQDGSFLTDQAIEKEIFRLQSFYPENHKFVLKILGKLATDIETLNAKVQFVEKLLPSTPILVEVSYERLMLLCRLPESIFLHSWTYPALKYFLRRGDEEQCREEIIKLIDSIQEFSDIQLVITLSVSRPFPALKELLSILRKESKTVRFVIIALERPPKQILRSAQLKAANSNKQEVKEAPQTMSPAPNKEAQILPPPKQGFKKISISSGGKGRVEFIQEFKEAGFRMKWRFMTEENDIAFGVVFTPTGSSALEEVKPMQRYACNKKPVEGEVLVKQPGVYRLRWDNSYSLLKKKILYYSTSIDEERTGTSTILSPDEELISLDTLDPFELLQAIEASADGSISVADFFPVRVGHVFEPFFAALGYGKFTVRPSPFCGFATCLLTMEDMDIESKPISHFINIKQFYFDMLPHLKELEKQNLVTSILSARKIKKIIKKCSFKSVELPDIVSYFTDTSKASITQKFVQKAQFIIVHNTMDIAALDISRRCNCTVSTSYPSAPNKAGLAASCTGCI